MKRYLTFFALIFLTGCYDTEVHETVNRTKHINIETEVLVKNIPSNDEFQIVTIGGCEYIVYKEVVRVGAVSGGAIGGAGWIRKSQRRRYG